jgi:hypothetical protein
MSGDGSGVCAVCGTSAHRYGTSDPQHKYDAMGCVNMLRPLLLEAVYALDRVRDGYAFLPAINGAFDATADEVKREANDMLDHFTGQVNAFLAKPDVQRLMEAAYADHHRAAS